MPIESKPGVHGDVWGAQLVRALAEASQDCVWILSLDGRLAYASPKSVRVIAQACEDAIGRRLADLWPEESRFSLNRALDAAARGEITRFRAFFHRDGRAAYWETTFSPIRSSQGDIVNLLALARDVTAEVETNGFLHTVINLLPSPLLVKNADDRRYLLVNRAAEDIFGLVADDALGRTAREVLGPDARTLEAEEDEVLGAGELRAFDFKTSDLDGRPSRDLSLKILATHDDLGPRHLIVLGEDVTERLKTAEGLRAALRAAEQASEAKSAFLANMSHELRTPLNGIVAGADLMARDELPAQARELVDMIRGSSELLERLVSDILDLARAEAGQITLESRPFDLGETLRSAAALFRLDAERKGLALDLRLSPAVEGWVLGDAMRLRQVLGNLLSNAIKFTEQGRIRLEAVRTRDGSVRITVTDTGLGFDPALKGRLFERFQQADETLARRFGGAGLGLAICRELVTLAGGSMDCDSRPGEGSRFWFEIALPPHATRTEGRRPEAELHPGAGLRVLLADDHPINRQVVQIMLQAVAQVEAVENGAQAVAAFQAGRFDLILMDMQMPQMDGLEAVRQIRAIEARTGGATPIIMLTANARPEHVAVSAAAGADRHLGKPITAAALFEAIHDALGRRASPETETAVLYPGFAHGAP
ncbi:MAG: PAS domain-containing protein [Caulobacteraceae bacterium]